MAVGPRAGVTRRRFLKTGAAAVGTFVLSGRLVAAQATAPVEPGKAIAAVTAWLRITPNDTYTIVASQSEMGQGTSTTLAATMADELDLGWDQVHIEFAPFAPAYQHPVYHWMFTGNSESSSAFYELMRRMGAAAREMLIAAAAERLSVPAAALTTERGIIRHAASGRSLTFGAVAGDAAKRPVPSDPPLKAKLSLIGHPLPRWDVPSKVDGSAVFGIDVKLPNMLIATVRCAPRFGSRLVKYDAAAIKAKAGVAAIVEVPNGLSVVADTFWHAHRALADAKLEWSDEGSTLASAGGLPAIYAAKLESGPFFAHKTIGDAPTALAKSDRHLEAVYHIPFQAHATMEPMNCTVRVADGACEIWAPTQGVEMTQNVAHQVTGLPLDRIVVHRTFLGGGFGRRLLGDFVKQALIVALAVKRPVKLIWSREEDMTRDAYRPAMLHRVAAALDERGLPAAMAHRVVSPSYLLYVFPRYAFPQIKDWTEPAPPPEKIDAMAVEGLVEPLYAVPNLLVEQHRLALDVPVSVWRTTGHGPNNFVLESFVDEMAHAARRDPVAYRRVLVAHNPRALKLLDLAAAKSGWGKKLPAHAGRGIALAGAFGGLAAAVAELTVTGSRIKFHRIVAAVDCGRTLDPRIAEANISGGIVWGLSALRTAVTFDTGRVQQSNFDAFTPFHLWETPKIEVHFINSGEKIGGTGELGPVPLHAAVGNAIFAATGRRIRALPLSESGLHFA